MHTSEYGILLEWVRQQAILNRHDVGQLKRLDLAEQLISVLNQDLISCSGQKHSMLGILWSTQYYATVQQKRPMRGKLSGVPRWQQLPELSMKGP